jgi:hypothetical protein
MKQKEDRMKVGFGLLQLRRASCCVAEEPPLLVVPLSFAWLSLLLQFQIPIESELGVFLCSLIAPLRQFDSRLAGRCSRSLNCRNGRVAERFKALVLKTSRGHTLVGSNPTPSAILFDRRAATLLRASKEGIALCCRFLAAPEQRLI